MAPGTAAGSLAGAKGLPNADIPPAQDDLINGCRYYPFPKRQSALVKLDSGMLYWLRWMKWFLFGKREKLPLFDGTHSEKFWATRDTEEASSAPDYWEQRRHPSRTAIADVIAVLEGDSLLEIGVHAGPTLWAIAQKKRFARLAGTDLSETVLDFTRRNLPDVELFRASADKLPFPDKSFDIVVTAGVLVCIGPEAIEKSLSELARVSRRYIVLCEPATGWRGERTERYSNTSYWVRDYGAMMEGRARVIKRLKLPRKAVSGHLNSIRVLELLPLGGR